MKHIMIITLMCSLSCKQLWATEVESPPREKVLTESQGLREKVYKQLEILKFDSNQLSEKIKIDIRDQYGYKVSCDDGTIGMGGITESQCQMALENLKVALSTVDPIVARSKIEEVEIVIGKMGQWQHVTSLSKEVKLPYTTPPARMTVFINEQLKILYDTSVAGLEQLTSDTVKSLQEKYLVKILAENGVDSVDYLDALKNLELALQQAYGNAEPSEEQLLKFGFDSIVIANNNVSLYEDAGELRIKVNRKDSPGEMFNHIINQVRPPEGEHVNSQNDSDYTWLKVEQFRKSRAEAKELMAWLKENMPQHKVDCVLDRAYPRNVDMKECLKGLENLHWFVVQYGPVDSVAGLTNVQKVLIASPLVKDHLYLSQDKSLVLGYTTSPEEIHNLTL